MIDLAERLQRLGTENAFAVSLAAADWASKGNRVFPFHLGDINIPTSARIASAANEALAAGKTGYCAAAGIVPLREALAQQVGEQRALTIDPASVVVQPGGKPVITKFIQAVMNAGDGVLYPNPGFPIYESQISYYGGEPLAYRYVETSTGFAIDLDHLRSLITSKTVAIVYNDLQNPLGCESSAAEREAIAKIAQTHNLWVLSDEAYFETRYSGKSQSIASLPGMQERTVILYTFSKKYAMTGWRLGAAIAPLSIAAQIARMNSNDESCTTHFVQLAGVAALGLPQSETQLLLDELKLRRDTAHTHLTQIPGVVCPKPESTFYLYANVTKTLEVAGFSDVAVFAEEALQNTGVSFCTRRHFGTPQPGETEQYARFAYSGIGESDITDGLKGLRSWIESRS
jgi:aspartate/methionine/tyrosine aminotransferase